MRKIWYILFVLLISTAYSAVYKNIDEKGNITFSDKPIPRQKTTSFDIRNTKPSLVEDKTKRSGFRYSNDMPWDKKPYEYESIAIITPKAEETFHNTDSVMIEVEINPELYQNHHVRLKAKINDEEVVYKPSKQKIFSVQTLERGQYTFWAEILDKNEKVIKISNPINFYVQRNSILLPVD